MSVPVSLRQNPDLDSWLRIDAEAPTVTVFSGKVELGQGITTALALIAAEELELSLERVRVLTADSGRGPDEYYTAGSQSIEDSGTALRHAAAHARQLLLELAAARLGVASPALEVDDGVIRVAGSAAGSAAPSTTYWALMGGRRFARRVDVSVATRAPERYRLLGKGTQRRLDLPAKVFGQPVFVHDLVLPGMLHGRVVRPPDPRARLVSIDVDDLTGRDGVVCVVRDGSFLGVIAEREEQAVTAAARLLSRARWDVPVRDPGLAELQGADVEGYLRAHVARSLPVRDGVALDEPVPAFEPPPAQRRIAASYYRPHLRHASLGPSAAVAFVEAGRATVYTHAQGVSMLAPGIARVLGVAPDAVRAIHVEGAGCYGHNGADDAALDAVLLARAVAPRPVRLQWSRADEHAFAPCGPAAVIDLVATLDDSGAIGAFSLEAYSATHLGRTVPWEQGSSLLGAWQLASPLPAPRPRPALGVPHAGIHRNADPLYRLPNKRIVKHFVAPSPLRTSALRSLGAFANVFAIESFMDELAHAAGIDPIEFRLRHLDDARARAVIEAAARHANWRGGALASAGDNPRGQGFGFAQYKNQKTYAAVVLEVEVCDADLSVVPVRAVIAADAGRVIDRDGLCQQLEGGLIQALSWSLLEAVRLDQGGVSGLDFEGYPILGWERVPEIETIVLDRPASPPLGAGEATQGPTPAALCNAVFAAIGLRARRLPLTPDMLRSALDAD
jgi:CO/xanthine dehydrogenase Mo-binding subunit